MHNYPILKNLLIAIWVMSVSTDISADNILNDINRRYASRIGPEELAIIVNDADPISVKIAEYYGSKRHIPKANLIHVNFVPGQSVMTSTQFKKIKAIVDAKTSQNIQAYVLTWTIPYAVECMSITSAFAMGFDKEAFCATECKPTKVSPYFNSDSRRPYDDYKIRPTMSLVGKNFQAVKALIDRGTVSDSSFPKGVGYLVSTSDTARNVRAVFYPEVLQKLGWGYDLRVVNADFIKNKKDVVFYFTGVVSVQALETIHFMPGAMADHLTSTGGVLNGHEQMSSLRWLEAGATGSYGAVAEPCNFPQKFPHPGIAISLYLAGESLIEAYWKSVAWPGQGIFIGEPLAAPFRR